MVDVPYLVRNGFEQILPTLAAVPDLEEGVQEAKDHGDSWKEAHPCPLGVLPSIQVYVPWLVVGFEIAGFFFEMPVALGQGLCTRIVRQPYAQDTLPSHSGGHIGLLAIESGMLLVGQEIHRQTLGVFDGSAHNGVTAHGDVGPVPEHVIVPKNIGQSPEGYSPFAQKQGLFYLIRLCDQVGHHVRRTDLVDFSVSQLDAAHLKAFLLHGKGCETLKIKPLGHWSGK